MTIEHRKVSSLGSLIQTGIGEKLLTLITDTYQFFLRN